VARDWLKQKRRDRATQAHRSALEDAALFDEAPEPQPSKAQARAEAERLIADYRGPVRRLPTYAALRCRSCGHRGTARVPPGANPSFRCSHCGSSLVAWRV
jgi:DNA-directed RNA polymerase subunit RPC12/RpoP